MRKKERKKENTINTLRLLHEIQNFNLKLIREEVKTKIDYLELIIRTYGLLITASH